MSLTPEQFTDILIKPQPVPATGAMATLRWIFTGHAGTVTRLLSLNEAMAVLRENDAPAHHIYQIRELLHRTVPVLIGNYLTQEMRRGGVVITDEIVRSDDHYLGARPRQGDLCLSRSPHMIEMLYINCVRALHFMDLPNGNNVVPMRRRPAAK